MADVDTLVGLFKAEVLRIRPDLSDFSKGSVLYTLARAVGATINDVYNELDALRSSGLLFNSSVSPSLLNSISPALEPIQGEYATGSVLCSSLANVDTLVTTGAILTEPISTKQFKVVSLSNVVVTPLVERRLEIEALEPGAEYNLPSGTNLININYPRLIFTIGDYRNINGEAVGDLTGGISKETNLQYQTRVLQYLLGYRVTQKQAIVNYLAQTRQIKEVSFNTLSNGILTIWITSKINYTPSQLNDINVEIQELLPLGVFSEVKQLQYINLPIRLAVFESINTVTVNFIRELLTEYVNKLSSGAFINPTIIRNLISDRTGIVVRVISPTDTVTLESNQKFLINSVDLINVS